MGNGTKRRQIGLSVLVMAVYVVVLFHNLDESERRSLELKERPIAGDHIGISFRVVAVNPRSSDLTARISFRLDGSIAKDPVTPAVDLTLFLNDIRGPQQIALPRGRRINPIETFFSLNGNENKYPADFYEIPIRMMVTRQGRIAPAAQPVTEQASSNAGPHAENDDGLVVPAALEGECIPIAPSITASIPGLKFKNENVVRTGQGIEGFNLVVRRADNVIVVSVLIMVLMISLAMSVLIMGIQSASGEKIELLALSLSVSLLFGLPALRNAQPGVPALGAFGDYLSFLWAEPIVAVSAIIVIWTWLMRQRHSK
jgi:hypothetical protein